MALFHTFKFPKYAIPALDSSVQSLGVMEEYCHKNKSQCNLHHSFQLGRDVANSYRAEIPSGKICTLNAGFLYIPRMLC